MFMFHKVPHMCCTFSMYIWQGLTLLSPAPWEPTAMCQGRSTTMSVLIVTLGTTVPRWLVGLQQGPAGEGTIVQGPPKPPYSTSLTQVST